LHTNEGAILDTICQILEQLNGGSGRTNTVMDLQTVLNNGDTASDASSGHSTFTLVKSTGGATSYGPDGVSMLGQVSGSPIVTLQDDGSDNAFMEFNNSIGTLKVQLYNNGTITVTNDDGTRSVGFVAGATGANNTYIKFRNGANRGSLFADNITGARDWQMPDHTGEITTNKQGINISSGALVAASSWTVTIAPGYTPLNIIVTPIDGAAAAALVGYYINNITSTQFVINFAAPVTGTLHINWQAF
jgi:hypothetical protein